MIEKRLLIARHGETDFNKKGLLQGRGIDAPLNATGRRQAEQLAGYIGGYETGLIASSSLQRTWQTAEPLSLKTTLTTLQREGLDEMDFGDFEGRPYLDAADELELLKKSWQSGELSVPVPGGESPAEVFDRANEEVMALLKGSQADTVVLFLHGRLIRILLSKWLGYGLENMHKIEHQNGAVYQIVYNGRYRPVYLNKTDHLT
jgi:broad specificity phosphatase PhoE